MDILTRAVDDAQVRKLKQLYMNVFPRLLKQASQTVIRGDLLPYSFTGQYPGRAIAVKACNTFIQRVADLVGAEITESMERKKKLPFTYTVGAGNAMLEHFIGGCTANGVDYDVVLLVTRLGDSTFTGACSFTVDFIVEDVH